jgi:hypothetical protein
MGNRGRLVGAYAVAYTKGKIPVLIRRTWEHYRALHNRTAWKTNPDDMIETRVICAALRRQYNISGLYTEAEFGGVDEGDGALQELQANQNALRATEERVAELRAQIAEIEPQKDEEDMPTAVVDAETGEILDVDPSQEVFPEQEHGPVTVDMDAYIIEPDEELEDAVSREPADDALRKRRIKYMTLWSSKVGADEDFRHRWQKAAIGKASTTHWTIHEFDDAIELIESDGWVAFVTKKGQKEIQGELGA